MTVPAASIIDFTFNLDEKNNQLKDLTIIFVNNIINITDSIINNLKAESENIAEHVLEVSMPTSGELRIKINFDNIHLVSVDFISNVLKSEHLAALAKQLRNTIVKPDEGATKNMFIEFVKEILEIKNKKIREIKIENERILNLEIENQNKAMEHVREKRYLSGGKNIKTKKTQKIKDKKFILRL